MNTKISRNATQSVAAVLGLPAVNAYSDESLAACVVKPGGHEAPVRTAAVGWSRRLWSITAIARNAKFGGMRSVAICDSFERATEIVERNESDIWEHSYMLVVIEEFDAGMLYGGMNQTSYWYRWNLDDSRYEAIEVPEAYQDTVGYAVG